MSDVVINTLWPLIIWIRQGYINVDPAVTAAPDPVCIACQYGKAHRKLHTTGNVSIAARHSFPGAGISSNQLEAGYPGKLSTSCSIPTSRRYKYCNIWVDNYSTCIYPTFHEMKDVSEMIKSKMEFQNVAA